MTGSDIEATSNGMLGPQKVGFSCTVYVDQNYICGADDDAQEAAYDFFIAGSGPGILYQYCCHIDFLISGHEMKDSRSESIVVAVVWSIESPKTYCCIYN